MSATPQIRRSQRGTLQLPCSAKWNAVALAHFWAKLKLWCAAQGHRHQLESTRTKSARVPIQFQELDHQAMLICHTCSYFAWTYWQLHGQVSSNESGTCAWHVTSAEAAPWYLSNAPANSGCQSNASGQHLRHCKCDTSLCQTNVLAWCLVYTFSRSTIKKSYASRVFIAPLRN